MALILVFSCAVLVLHTYITKRFPANAPPPPEVEFFPPTASSSAEPEPDAAASSTAEHLNGAAVSIEADCSGRIRGSAEASTSGTANDSELDLLCTPCFERLQLHAVMLLSHAAKDVIVAAALIKLSLDPVCAVAGARVGKDVVVAQSKATPGKKPKLSVKEAVVFLTKSPQMQCLAVMALAQGLSTNLIEIAWKNHLHMLHPSPAAYSVGFHLSQRVPGLLWNWSGCSRCSIMQVRFSDS
jgi:hypothetical protein